MGNTTIQGNFVHSLTEYILANYQISDILKMIDEFPMQEFKESEAYKIALKAAQSFDPHNLYDDDALYESINQFSFYIQSLAFDDGQAIFTSAQFKSKEHYLQNFKRKLTEFFKTEMNDEEIYRISFLEYPVSVTDPTTKRTIQGTIDYLDIQAWRTGDSVDIAIEVSDLKTGWTAIEVKDNPQLKIYASLASFAVMQLIGSLKSLPHIFYTLETIKLRIIQPPLYNSEAIFPAVKQFTPKAVREYIAEIFANVQKQIKVNAKKMNVGSHCRYCNAFDVCKDFKKEILNFLEPTFQDKTIDRIDEWSKMLKYVGPVKTAAEDLQRLAKQYISLGNEIPGYTTKPRRGKRVAINAAAFEEKLKELISGKKGIKIEHFMQTGLRSVKEIEDLLKRRGIATKEDLEAFYFQPVSHILDEVK